MCVRSLINRSWSGAISTLGSGPILALGPPILPAATWRELGEVSLSLVFTEWLVPALALQFATIHTLQTLGLLKIKRLGSIGTLRL